MGGCDKFPQVVGLWFGGGYVVLWCLCCVLSADCQGVCGLDGFGTVFGSRGCCWVRFCGLNFGIRLGLRDSGAYRIMVVKHVLKLNKGTKHWSYRVFISIAAGMWWALGSLGLSQVSGFGLWGWAWQRVWLMEGCLFSRFSLALRASLAMCNRLGEIQLHSG